MRPAGLAIFPSFTESLESVLGFMYLDVLGYVTTGSGNLIDTPGAALTLPWRRQDGSLASRDEVIAQWMRVKSRQDMAKWGGAHFAKLTTIRLDTAGIDALFRDTLERNDRALVRRFPNFEDFCTDMQVALHSLCWACGNAYEFPKMDAAIRDGDYDLAALEIYMRPESNPGNDLRKRNAANKILMQNAAWVRAFQLDPEKLYWPVNLSALAQEAIATEPDGIPDLAPGSDPEETTVHDLPLGKRIVEPLDIPHPRVPLGRPALDDPELDDTDET